jgi:hypothetical protein
MAGTMTVSSVSGILKELYDQQKVQWLTYKDNPFLAMVRKEEKFPGKYFPQPVVFGLSQGVSATYSYASANQSSALVAEFLCTRVADFSVATIDGQLLAAAQTDPGSFIDGAELMIDASFQSATNRLASALFRNGAGTIGQIASLAHVSGSGPYISTITLTNPDDGTQFSPGQVIVNVQNVDGSGTAPADSATITNVNLNAGTMTTTSATDISSAFTANYFLATQGDLPNASNNNYQPSGSTGTNSLLRIAGLAAWLPIAGPTSSPFFGVDRTQDVQKLSGVSFDGRQLSLEEALLQGTGRVAMVGGRVDTGVCSYATYTALQTSLGSKLQYIDTKVGDIGFRGVVVNGANTTMNVFPDRSCPDGLIYGLEMDSWHLRSQNPAPHILRYMDEIEILRVPGVDSAELRVGSYSQLICSKPGHNLVIQVQLQAF